MSNRPFRLTIVHPCVGRYRNMKRYMRSWRMEPLPPAMLAALAPEDIEVRFYDDRMEAIPYDEPCDLVAMSVETYTAKRAYQIATEYRRRRVPVVMGGFHATLCPEEVGRYCESIVIGEAEDIFPKVIDDYRHGTAQHTYQAVKRPGRLATTPDRRIFQGKGYLPLNLVEFSRGCKFVCDFCAIQSAYNATHNCRPVDHVVDEVRRVHRPGRMVFFVDDNLTSNLPAAKELMRALIPLRIRWVTQCDITVGHDPEALELMRRSGCQGVLIGLESLDRDSLKAMNKGFNLMRGGPAEAIANFQRHGLRVYGTFIFGYDTDTPETFDTNLAFAREQGLFIAAFNHITPFPGTPLYKRMEANGQLRYDAWWLDDNYRYGDVPFEPAGMAAEELARRCSEARQRFYSWRNIVARARTPVNYRSPWMLLNYLVINAMHHFDVETRDGLPLGDEAWQGELIEA